MVIEFKKDLKKEFFSEKQTKLEVAQRLINIAESGYRAREGEMNTLVSIKKMRKCLGFKSDINRE